LKFGEYLTDVVHVSSRIFACLNPCTRESILQQLNLLVRIEGPVARLHEILGDLQILASMLRTEFGNVAVIFRFCESLTT